MPLYLYTTVVGVGKEGGRIRSASLFFGGEMLEVEADVFIDATGGAYLCQLAGEAIRRGDEECNVQAPTMVSYYTGVDFERYEAFLKTYEDGIKPAKINMIHALVPKAVEAGILDAVDLHHPGIFRHLPDASSGTMNTGHEYGADVFTARGMTQATLEGRRQAHRLLRFYRAYIPGFENARIPTTGSELALRESGRVEGEYTVTFEDKSAYRKFSDSVMRFDRKTLGQIRLQSYCMMMGQATGIAAALSENGVVKHLDVKMLQHRLAQLGVEV